MGRRILSRTYFERDTLQVARDLLGKRLVRRTDATSLHGRIVEVEAYVGFKDRASHASRGRTARTEVMFGPAGVAYVYLVYGMHHCFNIVTERQGYPAAVLVRAVEHATGLIDGPGRVCRLFQIDRALNGTDLTRGRHLWVEDSGDVVTGREIAKLPRVGVEYAGEWAAKPWRFRLRAYVNERRGSSKNPRTG